MEVLYQTEPQALGSVHVTSDAEPFEGSGREVASLLSAHHG